MSHYQSIKNCARCGEAHDDLFVRHFEHQPRPSDFVLGDLPEDAGAGEIYGWAQCPNKRAPILFTIFDLPGSER